MTVFSQMACALAIVFDKRESGMRSSQYPIESALLFVFGVILRLASQCCPAFVCKMQTVTARGDRLAKGHVVYYAIFGVQLQAFEGVPLFRMPYVRGIRRSMNGEGPPTWRKAPSRFRA